VTRRDPPAIASRASNPAADNPNPHFPHDRTLARCSPCPPR
jgi:hypothetical protein